MPLSSHRGWRSWSASGVVLSMRWPRPTEPSTHVPAPSLPLWAMALVIRLQGVRVDWTTVEMDNSGDSTHCFLSIGHFRCRARGVLDRCALVADRQHGWCTPSWQEAQRVGCDELAGLDASMGTTLGAVALGRRPAALAMSRSR